jgi:hypothetical protein
MEKPAKPPDRLDEQFAITNVVLVQEQEELEEQEELDMQEEDWVSDEGPSDEDDWPMPDCMDWSRGYGAEGAECIPEQAGPPAGAYACIRVPEEQKTGQQARVAGIKEQLTSLLAQPQEKWLSTAPAARIGRLTTSGMSAGATATTSRDQAQGATGSGARYELQPSREKGSRGEPPLGGLWKGADETGQQEEHTRSCAASESAPECGATSAAHPDVPPGNPAAVATTQRQKEAREKAATERLPERGSPVEAQQALPQEEAAREAGEEGLPEWGSPVEAQLKLCQEESWAEARKRPEENWAEARGRPEAVMEKACGKTGGNGEGEQESCGNGDKRPAGIAASWEEREDFVGKVEDEGDEDNPQYEIRGQAGHPVPVGHESCRQRTWEPGKLHSGLREEKELEPVENSPSFNAATGRRADWGSVSPAYGHVKSALVKCNMKENPGTSILVMKGEHGQEVPCDLGQVTAILGITCPPLLPPPPGHSGQNTLPPPFRGHTPPLAPVPQEASLRESTLRPRVQDQRPCDGQEEDEKTIGSFSAAF